MPRKSKREGMGIPIRDTCIYTLSFADDQVVTVQDEKDLAYTLRKLEQEYSKNELEINLTRPAD